MSVEERLNLSGAIHLISPDRQSVMVYEEKLSAQGLYGFLFTPSYMRVLHFPLWTHFLDHFHEKHTQESWREWDAEEEEHEMMWWSHATKRIHVKYQIFFEDHLMECFHS